MRFVLALVLLLAGCIGPAASPQKESGCVMPAIGTTGSRIVHLQVANEMERDACIFVLLDGTIVGGRDAAAEAPGLHANPAPAGDVRWARESVLVRIQEGATGRGYEERVTLGRETWVVGWLDEEGGNVETYDQQPMWM